jgi:PHD/YefM family antitoxin component YafN of YafNO toxin-antitoxin module
MVSLANIHSLSDFQRRTKEHIRRLKKSGEPAVLTVNGQAELVVLSAAAYQRMVDEMEMLENLVSIQKGFAEADRGEGIPAGELIRRLCGKKAARKSV